MNITSILDLLDSYPNPIPAGSIPYFDGCNWVTAVLPESGLNTCEDVHACIDWEFISSLLQLDESLSIEGGVLHVNETWVNSVVNVVLDGSDLTVGGTTVDLSDLLGDFMLTFSDGANSFNISHNDTVMLEGLDGMRFIAAAPNRLQVGLPVNPAHMQVLTWDADQNVAFWNNEQCCAQTLSFDTDTNILSISGTNAVDLTSINTDNQELILDGNVLSITQLNSAPQSVDLTNVNEHTLTLTNNILSIIGADNVVNNTVNLINVGPKTLTFDYDTNEIELRNDNDIVVSHVNISGVNNQQLQVRAGPNACSNGWVQIGITLPNQDTQWVDLPKAEIQCCDDILTCPGYVALEDQIVAAFSEIAILRTQVEMLQQQVP